MRRAVVIGGSMAGLAASGVLAKRAEQVTIVEAREVPDGVVSISPQGEAPHLLLAGGCEALEAIFPGLRADLLAEGALRASMRDMRQWNHGYRARPANGAPMALSSRALLETVVRRRALAAANLDWITAAADGLIVEDRRVRAVKLADGTALEADLVVDASGRGGRASAWLAQAGWPEPPVETVGVGIRYLAAEIERRPGDADGDLMLFVQNTPPAGRRFGLAFAVEHDRWKVLLGGYFGDAPPQDDAGFAAYAASLGAPDVAELIAGRERLGPWRRFAFPASVRPKPPAAPPAGLVRLGDAVASFNPVYGQGMTSAALQARRLGENLDRHGTGEALVRAQTRDAQRIVAGAWALSTGGDFAYPETTGRRPPLQRLTGAYARRVMRASLRDPVVSEAVTRTLGWLKSPASLMAPRVLSRVVRT